MPCSSSSANLINRFSPDSLSALHRSARRARRARARARSQNVSEDRALSVLSRSQPAHEGRGAAHTWVCARKCSPTYTSGRRPSSASSPRVSTRCERAKRSRYRRTGSSTSHRVSRRPRGRLARAAGGGEQGGRAITHPCPAEGAGASALGAAVSSASGVSDISSSALDSSWIRTCATSGARARAPSPPRPRARISHRRVFWAWAAQQFSTDCARRRARRRRGPRTMRYGGRLRQHVCSPSSGTHPVVFNHAAEPLERTARRPLSPRTFLYRAG